MDGLVFKTLGGLAACGGVVGGGMLIKHSFFSEDKSLANKLKSKKYDLLAFDKTHDSHWTKIAEAYKTQIGTKASLKINGTTITGTTENDLTALKNACKSIIESDFSQANYDLAIKWCVVPETVSARITKDGRKTLKLDSTDSSEIPSWEVLMKKHNDETVSDKKFSDLASLTTKTSSKATEETEIAKLRNKCNGIKDKKTYEAEYESSYQKFNDFCSVDIVK